MVRKSSWDHWYWKFNKKISRLEHEVCYQSARTFRINCVGGHDMEDIEDTKFVFESLGLAPLPPRRFHGEK